MKTLMIVLFIFPLVVFAQLDNLEKSTLNTVNKSQKTRKLINETDSERQPASVKSELEDFEKLMKDDNSWDEELNQILEN